MMAYPAALTRAEILALVKLNAGNRSDKDEVVHQALNSALVQIGQLHDFSAVKFTSSVALTLDTEIAGVPDGTRRIDWVKLTDTSSETSALIEIRSLAWMDDAYPNRVYDGSGYPAGLAIEGDSFHVAPYPDSSDYQLEVHGVRYFTTFDSADATCEVAMLNDALIAFASADVFASLESFVSEKSWRQRYIAAVSAAITEDKRFVRTEHRMRPVDEVRPNTGVYRFTGDVRRVT